MTKHSKYSCPGCRAHEIRYRVYRLTGKDFYPALQNRWPGNWRIEKFINGGMVSRDGGISAESIWKTLRLRGW